MTSSDGGASPPTRFASPSDPEKSAAPIAGSQQKRELEIEDQSSRHSFRRLLLIYTGIGFSLFLSFLDVASVATAGPVIGDDLQAVSSISWLGTSYMVANCSLSLVYGRMSDIFGRKNMLQIALACMGIGNLLCGFAKTPIQLYSFRAITGMGGGGVVGIAMIMVSDLVSLKDRGKYQGFITASSAMGTAAGALLGGVFGSAGNWRWIFWMTTPACIATIVLNHFILPFKPLAGGMRKKLAMIDYMGNFWSTSFTILLLVPVSGGGSTFNWSSPVIVALLVVGGLSGVAFLVTEWKFARLPVLPLRLFEIRTVSVVFFQSLLVGIIYYGNQWYMPVYFERVKGYSSFQTGIWVLAFTTPQAFWSVGTGYLISKTGAYRWAILLGSGLWVLCTGLQTRFGESTSLGQVVGLLQMNAAALGMTLQTTIVALQAITPAPDRAIVTAGRNYFRAMGGGFGIAIANSIYNNVYTSSFEKTDSILTAEVAAIRTVFVFFTAVAGVCFLLCFGIKEVVLRQDAKPAKPEAALKKESTMPILDNASKVV